MTIRVLLKFAYLNELVMRQVNLNIGKINPIKKNRCDKHENMLIYVDGEFFNFVIGAGILIDLHLHVRIVYQHVLIEEKRQAK